MYAYSDVASSLNMTLSLHVCPSSISTVNIIAYRR